MESNRGTDEEIIVEVEFNQQQDVILNQVREEGRHGVEDAEIVRNAFREFARLLRVV